METMRSTQDWRQARETLVALGIVVGLVACVGCGGDDPVAPESPSVPRVLESYVTGEAAKLLDASGRLILPAPIPGQFPEIPASRASELAQAFVTTFGPYAKGDWEEWRGRTIRVERLTVCGRVTYARSSYEPALPDLTLWARKLLGSWWLVTLCDGKSAEVLIAVSVHDTDVRIDGRG